MHVAAGDQVSVQKTAFIAALVVLLFSLEKSGSKVEVPSVFGNDVGSGLTSASQDIDSSAASCSCLCACAPPIPCDFGRLVSSGPELVVTVAVAIGISVSS